MSDASNDRGGSKPPRTMFSLGRPGNRTQGAGDNTADAPAVDASTADAAVGQPTESTVLVESGYLCGNCEHPLPVGAAFCGECGTPVLGTVPGPGEQSPLTDLEVPDDAAGVHDAPAMPDQSPSDAVTGPPIPPPDVEVRPPGFMPPAVLYTDPGVHLEPLPAPTGSWGISSPTFGTVTTENPCTSASALAYASWADVSPEVARTWSVMLLGGVGVCQTHSMNPPLSTWLTPAG